MTARCVSRLREVTSKFDFSIFSCGMLDSATITIGGECDGLVLVLTANTTRRLVASRMKECLLQAGIPLIGTVLAERRFPIPERIYRVL
jgi:Mrp family chromosome partitioning ATPase